MRSYIRTLLVGDYRLFEAGDGQEALEIVQKHTVDLIVSDLMMPVMDGMELSRRIKENLATSHIPFLMLTALRSDVQEKRSFEIGVDEYLCKPFDEEVLRLRIRNILSLRRKYKKMFSSSSNVEELHVKEESRDKTFITNAVNLINRICHRRLPIFVTLLLCSHPQTSRKRHSLHLHLVPKSPVRYRRLLIQQF